MWSRNQQLLMVRFDLILNPLLRCIRLLLFCGFYYCCSLAVPSHFFLRNDAFPNPITWGLMAKPFIQNYNYKVRKLLFLIYQFNKGNFGFIYYKFVYDYLWKKIWMTKITDLQIKLYFEVVLFTLPFDLINAIYKNSMHKIRSNFALNQQLIWLYINYFKFINSIYWTKILIALIHDLCYPYLNYQLINKTHS